MFADKAYDSRKIFIIPKSNYRLRGKNGCRAMIRRSMEEPIAYLREHFKRNNSEASTLVC